MKGRVGFRPMRKFLSMMGASLFVLAFLLSPSSFTTTRARAQEMSKPQDQTVTITGKVTQVSDSSLTVVDDQKAEHTITLAEKTKITKAGKSAKAADIKADDSVVVVAQKGEGDAWTAVSVKVS